MLSSIFVKKKFTSYLNSHFKIDAYLTILYSYGVFLVFIHSMRVVALIILWLNIFTRVENDYGNWISESVKGEPFVSPKNW